jgi:hypothetical protein
VATVGKLTRGTRNACVARWRIAADHAKSLLGKFTRSHAVPKETEPACDVVLPMQNTIGFRECFRYSHINIYRVTNDPTDVYRDYSNSIIYLTLSNKRTNRYGHFN